jgi:GLPGLI family protein
MKLATFLKTPVIVLILFTSLFTFSQNNFQGKAYYMFKTSVDMNGFGGRQMSEERKKQIAERMKSMFEKRYILTFNKTESIYKEEERLETPGQGGGFRGMMGSFTGGNQYKNIKNNQLLQEQEFFGKQFLIKDSLPKLNWVMGSETKQIGKYMCFKATAIKPASGFDFSSFRRPSRDKAQDSTKTKAEEKVEAPKETEIVAWYTLQIPINQGPGEYWGLPGLILEVNAGRTTILCSKIVMNPEEKETIKVPSKGKEVTQKEYDEIITKKMKEMRENFRGRRPGGNHPRG